MRFWVVLAAILTVSLAGCETARERPTQAPPDIRGAIVINRAALWRTQPIADASLAIVPPDSAYLWRACVRAKVANIAGVVAEREFLVIRGLGEGTPDFDLDRVAQVCPGLSYSPFPELQGDYLKPQSKGKPMKEPKKK